ncbi:MAG: hypothetical protein K2X87_25540 [Gemmataceae bacterium]|nr:hypothetical protein [Gemmataceae bacterium]
MKRVRHTVVRVLGFVAGLLVIGSVMGPNEGYYGTPTPQEPYCCSREYDSCFGTGTCEKAFTDPDYYTCTKNGQQYTGINLKQMSFSPYGYCQLVSGSGGETFKCRKGQVYCAEIAVYKFGNCLTELCRYDVLKNDACWVKKGIFGGPEQWCN